MRRKLLLILPLLMGSAAHANPLLLEIWLNGRNTHVVARVMEKEGTLEISNADLADAGLAVPREGTQRLGAHTTIRAEEDVADQRLLLTLAPSRLSQTSMDLRPSIAEEVTPANRGAMLRYSLSASASDVAHPRNTASAGAALALTLFQDNARLTMTGFATAGLSARSARLDTALEFDTPSAPRRLILGDAVTGVPRWARSVRFGGIEIATDFSQQPDRVTFPLPQFFGLAAVPSTVDVFVGASRVFDGAVREGPFALDNLPIMTGGGAATVVVRDVLGRETTQTISLYTDPSLLADGLSSYSFDAGFVRRDYGISSADYATPLVSATWRKGLGDFTAELHGEFAQTLALMSGGVASSIGSFGAFSVDGAISRHDGYRGAMASANLSARAGALSFFGDIAAATGRFADLASLAGDVFPKLRYQAGVSASLRQSGTLSFSWIGSRVRGAPDDDLATASYSLSFGNGLFLGLTGFRDFSGRNWAGQMFFSMPLNGAILSGSASSGTDGQSAQATYDKPVNPDGGFGYRFRAGTLPSQRAEADATWIGDYGELDGAAALASGHAALRINASGGLVLLGDALYAARTPDGAVALVKAGAPGVRVLRENRVVARSGADGNALLTDLNPYAPNRIGVDPRDYPIDADIAVASRIVVPPRGAGVIVNLAPAAEHSFVAVIRLGNGAFPPVGALVRARTLKPSRIVGRDGEVFFGALNHPLDATVETGNGHCEVRIVPPRAVAGRIGRAGPFVCSSELAYAH
ncbi:MAG: fimbria/pilus outer membrane usher protein [Rhizomicrobium sp.]